MTVKLTINSRYLANPTALARAFALERVHGAEGFQAIALLEAGIKKAGVEEGSLPLLLEAYKQALSLGNSRQALALGEAIAKIFQEEHQLGEKIWAGMGIKPVTRFDEPKVVSAHLLERLARNREASFVQAQLTTSMASKVPTPHSTQGSIGSSINLTGIESVFRERIAPLLTGAKNLSELLRVVNQINETLVGAFQILFFDGHPYISYIESGKSFYAKQNISKGWVFIKGPHPTEKLILERGLEPKILRKRFIPPQGYFLVGLETNIFGSIIPIFSPSQDLIFYRDFSAFDTSSSFLPAIFTPTMESEEPRQSLQIPLYRMKYREVMKEASQDMLPEEIQSLIKSGHTLTTVHSAKYLDPTFIDNQTTDYSVLMMVAPQGIGRTGVILKNGIPLLVRHNGQEYFLEIKGVGVGTKDPDVGITHPRVSHVIRTGRATAEQAERELAGYSLTEFHIPIAPRYRQLRPRPVLGLTLPEYGSDEAVLYDWAVNKTERNRLAAQIFRLSTSTRRTAFTGNAAFGTNYSDRPKTLAFVREYYGKIVGDLLIRKSQAAYHSSLHAENMIYFPAHGVVLHTDYSDMHEEDDAFKFLIALWEYQVFTKKGGKEAQKQFEKGLRASLEPRGLWTKRMEDFFATLHSESEFETFIDGEYFFNFRLSKALKRKTGDVPLPSISKFGAAWIDSLLERDRPTDKADMEIQIRKMAQDLEQQIGFLERNIASTFFQRDFPKLVASLGGHIQEAKVLLRDMRVFYEQENRKRWKKSVEQYARIVASFFGRQAKIWDSVYAVFGFRGVSFAQFQQMRVFQHWAGNE